MVVRHMSFRPAFYRHFGINTFPVHAVHLYARPLLLPSAAYASRLICTTPRAQANTVPAHYAAIQQRRLRNQLISTRYSPRIPLC